MKIGFIGIGLMGRWIARNRLAGGHQLTVSDLRKDSAEELLSGEASWAETPGEVAKASELIFTSLPLPRDVESVCAGEAGILPAAAPQSTIVDLSTTDPETIQRIADAARSKDVHLLDAPVSGGTAGAESGADAGFAQRERGRDLSERTWSRTSAAGSDVRRDPRVRPGVRGAR